MKLMQINAVYPFGSTSKIVKYINDEVISNNNQSVICYGRGKNVKENNVYKLAPELIMKVQSLQSKITGYAYGGCYISTRSLINIIEKERPNIVHLHCINSYSVNIYKLLNYLKIRDIPTVLTLHAEFMYTAGCGHAFECDKWKYGCGHCPQKGKGRPSSKIFDRSSEEWKLMGECFDGFNNLVIVPVSEWLYSRAKESPFLKDKEFRVITNGIDTYNTFKLKDYYDLKRSLNLERKKIVLHVTPNFLDDNKGGKYVLEIAKRLENSDIKFIIIGFNGKRNNIPKNVITIEKIENQEELAKYYSMADVTLLASKRETFSMVCAESLSCGTPVVGFKAGAPETITIKDYSNFVEYGDVDALESTIKEYIYKKNINKEKLSLLACKKYSKKLMFDKYYEIYRGIVL